MNHAYDQLDEQSTPVFRGAWNDQLCLIGIPVEIDLLVSSDEYEEDGNRQHQTCIAELFASKGTDLSGATIDACCARITLRNANLAAGTT